MRAHTPLTDNQINEIIHHESSSRAEEDLSEYFQYRSLKCVSTSEPTPANNARTRELLDAMIPPIPDADPSSNEGLCASLEPCTREDVKEQWKTLDFILQLRQARETGICPIREQIYSNMFDELIRQETLNCPERGLMLTRVRDESKMTIRAYQTLYEVNLGYGSRKGIQAKSTLEGVQNSREEALERKNALEKELQLLKIEYTVREERAAEETKWMHKEYKERKEFFREQRKNLETYLKKKKEQLGES